MTTVDNANSWPHSLMSYTWPANEWKEGLPIGNGEIAAMVLGDVSMERLALNHERLWRGKHRNRSVEPKPRRLEEIRELFLAGKAFEAGELANECLGGAGGVLTKQGMPNRVDAYQPAGDLIITIRNDEEITDYQRRLDLDRALATVTHRSGPRLLRREYFAHCELPVIIARLSSDDGSEFKAELVLSRKEDPQCRITAYACETEFGFGGCFDEGIGFHVAARVIANGEVLADTGEHARVCVEASEVLILLTMAVDPSGRNAERDCKRQLDRACDGWQDLLGKHIEAHRNLYRRVRIDIGEDRPEIPTDTRLAELRSGTPDEGLFTLYANFGRYLLISSSREGGLPANLQGKWNEELDPPWQCDYHHDINLQMNYWPAEVCGLPECLEPLFDHIERLVPHGREVAKTLYNCRGVYIAITTDAWARTTPEARGWDVWTGAAAWLAQHMWWRWEYGRDMEFLRSRAYPFIREVATFYEDYLVPDPRTGYLVAIPSQSPENRFVGGTSPVSLCVSATMDVELIHEVLSNAIEASKALGLDEELRNRWERILSAIPPLQIGKHGQLQEWLEDYEEAEPEHRHVSHLYALFPGDRLTLEDEPELTQAARVSLERRLAVGGGQTGWSRAWVAALSARLREGDAAHGHLKCLMTDLASSSLLDLHPPGLFQIEGNLGGTAAMCEMLMQSHGGVIRILPALPKAWPDGCVKGLCARNGLKVDLAWKGGKATTVVLRARDDGECRLCPPIGQEVATISSVGKSVGKAVGVNKADGGDVITLDVTAGQTYELTFRDNACDNCN